MTNTLLLLSSPRGAASQSTRIATVLADRFAAAPGSKVQVHDLAAEALPHIDPTMRKAGCCRPTSAPPARRKRWPGLRRCSTS